MTVDITTDRDEYPVLETLPKSEIEKLEDLIRDRHPEWNITVEDCLGGKKLMLFQHDKFICDVVCHYYSYGGREGLLEFWNCKEHTPCVGWLTAEEALVLFEDELKD